MFTDRTIAPHTNRKCVPTLTYPLAHAQQTCLDVVTPWFTHQQESLHQADGKSYSDWLCKAVCESISPYS